MQTDILKWIQSFANPWLDGLMIGLSFIGDEEFYMAILPLIYFGVQKKIGLRLSVVLGLSMFANEVLKMWFAAPRPIGVDGVRSLYTESAPGYAFPSGHAQGTATFWGYLAAVVRRVWFTVFAAVMVLGVMLSRLYLGVHWPIDVLAGLVVGLLFVSGFLWVDASFTRKPLPLTVKLVVGIALPVLLFLVYHQENASKLAGFLRGAWVGYVLESEWVGMELARDWKKRLLVVLLGIVTVFALRAVLKGIMPVGPLGDALRYVVMGLWAMLGVPWLAVKGRLYPGKRAT
jgi:membrane-associated phospholipid phosphatase